MAQQQQPANVKQYQTRDGSTVLFLLELPETKASIRDARSFLCHALCQPAMNILPARSRDVQKLAADLTSASAKSPRDALLQRTINNARDYKDLVNSLIDSK